MSVASNEASSASGCRALLITLIMTAALVAVFAVLVLAPYMTGWVGRASGYPASGPWLWWTLQWPLLFAALLARSPASSTSAQTSTIPGFGSSPPEPSRPRLSGSLDQRCLACTPSGFSSYNKAWGSLAAVIVTLTWLWLCSVAIMFAAEVNAELERTREIHSGAPPSQTLTAGHKQSES